MIPMISSLHCAPGKLNDLQNISPDHISHYFFKRRVRVLKSKDQIMWSKQAWDLWKTS